MAKEVVEAPITGTVISLEVKVGDKVVYGKFAGTELEIEGIQYMIMRQTDIKLIIND